MSLAYVSLTEQKEYSRIQHTALDVTISTLIESCSAAVKDYLKEFSPYEVERNDDDDYVVDSNFEPVAKLDSNGTQVVRPQVKLAVMVEVDRYLKTPSGPDSPNQGYLSNASIALLYPLRDPALR